MSAFQSRAAKNRFPLVPQTFIIFTTIATFDNEQPIADAGRPPRLLHKLISIDRLVKRQLRDPGPMVR